jgi:2-hydroxycyclohexanecarboxyl-CoA dehydrogenase
MTKESMSDKLKGKVAIVTGSGSGIGAASARRLAKEGARVAVVDLDGSAAEKVAQEINDAGGQAMWKQVDVSSKQDVDQLVQDVLDRWEQIDILVNNAGFGEVQWFIDTDESMWDKTIAVNLKGTMFFSQAVLPDMIKRKSGKIINIASTGGKLGGAMLAIYSATKAGVSAFSKALAREVARHNINVNDICPGPIDTPMFNSMPQQLQKGSMASITIKRLGQPEEIASAVFFLASDDSSFITGHSLMVDGGQSMI